MHFARLIKALNGNRYRKTLVVSKTGGSYEYILDDADVELVSLNINTSSSTFRIMKSIFPLKKIIGEFDPDIVFSIMDFANVACLMAHRLARHRSRIIVDVQTSIKKAIEFENNLNKKIVLKWMKKSYKNADQILCLSRGVSEELQNLIPHTQQKTYSVIHNIGIEPLRILNPLPKNIHQICICGRLTALKGFDLVIQAIGSLVKLFPDIKLIVLGEGPEKVRLQNLSKELRISEHVDFRGFVNNVAEIMAQSQVFVLSSYYEGFGNVIVEAMAVGTPVIATECPYGPGEIITHGENGLLTGVGKSNEIAEAIKKLFTDEQVYKKIQRNGYERALDFTPEKIAAQHEDLLESMTEATL